MAYKHGNLSDISIREKCRLVCTKHIYGIYSFVNDSKTAYSLHHIIRTYKSQVQPLSYLLLVEKNTGDGIREIDCKDRLYKKVYNQLQRKNCRESLDYLALPKAPSYKYSSIKFALKAKDRRSMRKMMSRKFN